jgi:hypothetical protein
MTSDNPEFDKFDAVVRKVLTVSKTELQKREKKYQRQRVKKKLAKATLK